MGELEISTNNYESGDQIIDIVAKRTHALNERIKELNCLYGISKIGQNVNISLSDFIHQSLEHIPFGWQFPEITGARIILYNNVYATSNFKETPWIQSSPIILS